MVGEARAALSLLRLPRGLSDVASLLVSELVTNSVRHAGLGPDDAIRVSAVWSGESLRVRVQEPSEPILSSVAGAICPSPGASSGWGLYLVDRLATRWGVDARRGYWFEIETTEEAS